VGVQILSAAIIMMAAVPGQQGQRRGTVTVVSKSASRDSPAVRLERSGLRRSRCKVIEDWKCPFIFSSATLESEEVWSYPRGKESGKRGRSKTHARVRIKTVTDAELGPCLAPTCCCAVGRDELNTWPSTEEKTVN
jgi:hypothetical protein